MKDPNDKATRDLIDKPRPGRPRTGKAKTQAQIQREYRQRVKERQEARFNQSRAFAAICPGLYDLLRFFEGDNKEEFRDLVQGAYQGLPGLKCDYLHAGLRGFLAGMYHAGAFPIDRYMVLMDEADRLYGRG